MLKTRSSRLICLGYARRLTQGGEIGLNPEEFDEVYP
jgi:hypothetical protein